MSRVLLVADAAPGRKDLAAAIAAGGPHTVKAVSPGDLRISTARDWEPDVIVMDLATDGAALPLRIGMLRDPSLSGIPFVAMGESEDEARALGAHAFVHTPPEVDSLMDLIARLAALRLPLPV